MATCKNLSTRGRLGAAGFFNVNLGPPDISETTIAIKLNLKLPLDMVKYPHLVQKLLYYTTQLVKFVILYILYSSLFCYYVYLW